MFVLSPNVLWCKISLSAGDSNLENDRDLSPSVGDSNLENDCYILGITQQN